MLTEVDDPFVSLVLVWMTNMSDFEEDSGVHSQLQDERIDLPGDNEGMYAVLCQKCESHLFYMNSFNYHCSVHI